MPLEARLFSVCGLLCGQTQKRKFELPKIVTNIKGKDRFSGKKRSFPGAAGRIRTADLILTNTPRLMLRSTHSFPYIPRSPCAARVPGHTISRLVPLCSLRFYPISVICWKNVGKFRGQIPPALGPLKALLYALSIGSRPGSVNRFLCVPSPVESVFSILI